MVLTPDPPPTDGGYSYSHTDDDRPRSAMLKQTLALATCLSMRADLYHLKSFTGLRGDTAFICCCRYRLELVLIIAGAGATQTQQPSSSKRPLHYAGMAI